MTIDMISTVLKNHCVPEEIVELLGIDADELVECVGSYIYDNYDLVQSNLVKEGLIDEELDGD